jgi:hypothetical protein
MEWEVLEGVEACVFFGRIKCSLTLRNFSKYHIDMVVEKQGKDP